MAKARGLCSSKDAKPWKCRCGTVNHPKKSRFADVPSWECRGCKRKDGPKEIHIERMDEFGRVMTHKEAFHYLSHKFHDKGPDEMKLEQRQKKYQDDLKTKQMKSSETPLMSEEKMREAQARGQTPYLVLSGNAKSGMITEVAIA